MTADQPRRKRPNGAEWGLAVTFLLLLFVQTASAINRTSLTIDEGLHITSGYSILRTGDYQLVEEHPPLVKLMATWPLLLVPDLPDPTGLPGWEMEVATTDSVHLVQVTRELIYDYQPLDRLVFAARLPVALLALLLGAVVFCWAADRFGPKAGLLALFVLTFDPNILAHASVAATDLGAACFITIALFTFQRFLRRPTLGRWALAGLTLGLAQGAKLSAMLLLPTQGLLILAYGICGTENPPFPIPHSRFPIPDSRWRTVLLLGIAYAGMVVLAAVVLWAIYGFEVGPVPELGWSLPAPSHAIPWLRLREHMQGGHAAFLMGQVSHQGWWYYFPVALALKTPLPTLLLWLAALVALVLGQRQPWRDELALLLFPMLYLGFSLQSSLNIGYRHLLPILPLLAIFTGRLARCLRGLPRRLVATGLGLWLVVGTVSLYPHYLAYFNELAGGPDGGYRYLVDSNTDWGQALKELVSYQDARDAESVYLSMFTFLDPAIYGIRYQPLTPMHGNTPAIFPSRFNPPPGVYVISTTTLQGIPLADPEMYDWFRRREPDARIGHVMFLYNVPQAAEPASWVAQCIIPVAPLPPEVVAEGFGSDDLRRAYFDCTQSWLVPGGGQSPGWYVLFRDTAMQPNDFTQSHLARMRLIYEQGEPHLIPPFVVYEWAPGAATGPGLTQTGIVAPSDWPPPQVETEGEMLSAPLALEDGPEWLGYRLDLTQAQAGQRVELQTFWRVNQQATVPLSLMAHLIARDGQAIAVGDGLGVPIENWQPGDVINQRHLLEIPPDTPPGTYWVHIGAYTLTDLRRLVVASAEQPAADRILLKRLEVVE
jgi:4-amino-4-deoxy-L-arabinose transferase-like glycosyltransferase